MDSLRCLPGVGPKTAQRMALYLLERDRDGAQQLVTTLGEALERVGHCGQCRTLSEAPLCGLCADQRRDDGVLCVVEGPAEVIAVEQATGFRGRYFVLLGQLSPLDGIGPDQLGMDQLAERLAAGAVREVILATSATVEGEATAHYVAELARAQGVRASRIAYGVPVGGELDYVDGGTLAQAFSGRRDL